MKNLPDKIYLNLNMTPQEVVETEDKDFHEATKTWEITWSEERLSEHDPEYIRKDGMGKKIYIVTRGEYSDYHICAVFTTKKKAVDYVEQHGTRYDIEEYDLDEEVGKETQLWCIEFGVEDGELLDASPISYNRDKRDKVVDTCSIFDYWEREKDKSYIRFYIDADSMGRAVKIARERFAAVKANELIWLIITRPYEIDRYGRKKYDSFNVKTNEFVR